MFPECFKEVSRVFHGRGSFMDVSRVFHDFQGYFMIFKTVSRVFQGGFKGVSRKYEGCLMFQGGGSFKDVS